MKKSILLFTFLTFYLFSCSSSDDNSASNIQNLLGKWDLKTMKEANGTPIPLTVCAEIHDSTEFFANNMAISKWADFDDATGSNCGVESLQDTFTLNNNILTFKGAGNKYEFRYTVIELTSNKLTIKHIYSEEDGAGSGYNIPADEQITHSFEKVN